jgi:hypothetical protein
MTSRPPAILLGINGFLIAGMVAFNLAVPAPTHIRSSSGAAARLGTVAGQVEIRRSAQSDVWTPARPGDELQEGDEVRTGLFSEALLHLRGQSTILVAAGSSFVVGRDQVERASFELGLGQVTAAIAPAGERRFEFRSRGSDAVASTREGEFSLVTDGRGMVVLDSRAGDIELSAAGQTTTVPKGKRSVVSPSRPPGKLMPVPSSLALQVKWPPAKMDRKVTTVSGKAAPGATLLVNGVLARADPEGVFTVDVALEEGSNRVVISATDLAGNTASAESPEIEVDTRPPGIRVNAEGLWK